MPLRICHLILALLLAFATSTSAAPRVYSLIWLSDWPVAPETMTIGVSGGQLLRNTVAEDGKSGQIDATAEQACVTIRWAGQTQAGFPVAMSRSWMDGCSRVYLPMVVRYGE